MKIAILGTRGIPANYGGFETFAEQLATRLVTRGHELRVYCRRHNANYTSNEYRGVRLVVLPSIKHKYFDTISHTFLSIFHVLSTDAEVVLICNSANSIFAWIPRLVGKPTAVNVDGLEWQRAKWNWAGRAYFRLAEWLSTFLPTEIVTDARAIQEYYLARYGRRSTLIAYGAEADRTEKFDIPERFGFERGRYVLYVSRLEPENNALLVIRAFEQVATPLKLALVGGNPYDDSYLIELRKTNDPRIVFTGPIYGAGYQQFQSHAYCYVHATEVGGTHPALIEAMACGRCVLFLDTKENREVVEDAGIPFLRSERDLAEKLAYLIAHPEVREAYAQKALARALAHYHWDEITSRYEELFERLRPGKAAR